MKSKLPIFLLAAAALVILFTNSCKKDNSGTIPNLFPGGYWQLASIYRTRSLNDTTRTDTLNLTCNTSQIFTFSADGTCTYTNYDCSVKNPTSNGHWTISSDNHFLNSDIAAIDTATGKSFQPFANAEIYNVGQYSLVLVTGDLNQYYPSNVTVTRLRYSFVRQQKKQ